MKPHSSTILELTCMNVVIHGERTTPSIACRTYTERGWEQTPRMYCLLYDKEERVCTADTGDGGMHFSTHDCNFSSELLKRDRAISA